MSNRVYNRATRKWEDVQPGAPAPAPAPGTTFAKEAQPAVGLTLPGGATSTVGARLAALPGVRFDQPSSQPSGSTGTGAGAATTTPASTVASGFDANNNFAGKTSLTLQGQAPVPSTTSASTGAATPAQRTSIASGFDRPPPALPGDGPSHVATPDSTTTFFGPQGPVQIPTDSSVAAMSGNRALVTTGDQSRVVGGANPNAVAERSRTVGADGTTHIVTASGGRVDIPAAPSSPGGGTGTATGIVGQNGQPVVRTGQGQLAPGTVTPATTQASPSSVAQQPQVPAWIAGMTDPATFAKGGASPDSRGTGGTWTEDSAGTRAGQAVRAGLGNAGQAVGNAVDATLGAVGSGLSTAADFGRAVVGLPAGDQNTRQNAGVDAVNSYAANNPGLASQVKPPDASAAPAGSNMAGGYDLSAYNAKPASPMNTAAVTPGWSKAVPAASPDTAASAPMPLSDASAILSKPTGAAATFGSPDGGVTPGWNSAVSPGKIAAGFDTNVSSPATTAINTAAGGASFDSTNPFAGPTSISLQGTSGNSLDKIAAGFNAPGVSPAGANPGGPNPTDEELKRQQALATANKTAIGY